MPRNSAWRFRYPPKPITTGALEGARILYLRAPSTEFTASETAAIVAFVKGGGSLLLVLDEERRQSLEKTGVNNLISPFDMRLTPDTEYLHNNGAVAKAGEINKADRRGALQRRPRRRGRHGVRVSARQRGQALAPLGAYKRLDNGGRIVVLGEGMASLFLGDPNGVRLSGDSNEPDPLLGEGQRRLHGGGAHRGSPGNEQRERSHFVARKAFASDNSGRSLSAWLESVTSFS